MSDISTRLRKSAQECADENINGWGNLMTMAADEIERLQKENDLWVPNNECGSGSTQMSIELKDVMQWLDELATELELPKYEDSFEQYLVQEGAVHELKARIHKLNNGRIGL